MNTQFGRREILKAGGVGAVVSTAGCLDVLGGSKGEVAIGGKQFTEQFILSNISTLLLEDAGFGTDEKYPVGGGVANYEAVTSGRTDHYWEYTGTAWNHFLGHEEEKIRDPDELHRKVNEEFQEEHDVTWLQQAKFNNTYVVTANPGWQEETGVENLSQLAEHINDGGEVTWAVSEEYIDNPTAFGNLPDFYGFRDNMDNVTYEKMAIGTINYKAVANGDVDLGVGFATNPNLKTMDLGTVEDDENWFVIYYPAPVVHQDVLTDEMRQTLNKPTDALDTETIRSLNARVAQDKEDPADVAESWLSDEGMI